MLVCAPAYVGDDIAHARDQCRWFGGMVGNHVAEIVERYGSHSEVPAALTDYVERARATTTRTTAAPGTRHRVRARRDRRPLLHPGRAAPRREARELRDAGIDQFAIYLMHDAPDRTLEAYGAEVIPAFAEA